MGTVTTAWVIAVGLSVATNIMTTVLILVPLARCWRETLKALPDRKVPGLYSHVATVIIESAAPLAFFGICLLVSGAISQSFVGEYFALSSVRDDSKALLAERAQWMWRYTIFVVVGDILSLLYISFSVRLAPACLV
jgi:hypothetical protein